MKSVYCPLGDFGANQQLSLIKKGEKGLEKSLFFFFFFERKSFIICHDKAVTFAGDWDINKTTDSVRLGFDTS